MQVVVSPWQMNVNFQPSPRHRAAPVPAPMDINSADRAMIYDSGEVVVDDDNDDDGDTQRSSFGEQRGC